MIAALVCSVIQGSGAALASPPDEIVPRTWLVIAPVDASGRRPFRPDAVFARHLLDPHAAAPRPGETSNGELGQERSWREVEGKEDGTLEGDVAWAYTRVDSPVERVMMAQLFGAGRLFVNGAGFVGDLYAYGFGGVPVALAKGQNDLYVSGVRGAMKLRLWTPRDDVVFADWDVTKPDIVRNSGWGPGLPIGLTFFNATAARARIGVSVGFAGDLARSPDVEQVLYPLSPLKLGIDSWSALGSSESFVASVARDRAQAATVYVWNAASKSTHAYPLEIDARTSLEPCRVTFVSRIDGSVQYYALVPPKKLVEARARVVLSLHGASVEALGQARAYSSKDDFYIVCPTNRRPFGFDWQDWGRADAYEALAHAIASSIPTWGTDGKEPLVYLTGHSMGGHGTWHLAANDPGRFAAIAPSAGWSSFDAYGGRPDGALKALWHAADGGSDTLALVSNLAPIPTYILHGTGDDNVPASEAKAMQAALEAAGGKPTAHYEGGAGHWWDGDAAPGADCVDWPGIFELFRKHPGAKPTAEIDFTTLDPSIQSVQGWIEIVQPLEYGKPARVRTRLEPGSKELVITTENVGCLQFVDHPPGWDDEFARIDGDRFTFEQMARDRRFRREESAWHIDADAAGREKTPEIGGPFKRAFDHEFVLVYGTAGSADESRELFERARYDLETWWYRANATVPLLSDREFLANADEYGRRSAILYGNADTNAAWSDVFGADCPVVARRGRLELGEHEWKGDALGAVFCFPASRTWVPGTPFSASAFTDRLCAAFADTGVAGTRLGYDLAPFASGVGYPDYALFSADVLEKGDGGVLAAGWFDHAWNLDARGYVRAGPQPEKR